MKPQTGRQVIEWYFINIDQRQRFGKHLYPGEDEGFEGGKERFRERRENVL